ncbi:glutamate--tRNA ligase [Planctomyces sp. SH-PL14]|uniref:glutamate--tRNA ligase n=1 Tax=Planctomyces sp. SH-PL14 TaxID=1632864 RepID=UPI00078EB295|nr:glutamate--tRNA ligase [Planctomyces sp. SH-PL14]AMV17601.1 Glutamate--tRNA ligase [Planctomyces sp. SH-PL14]
MTVRTRFAPSPTGYMHIGGMRTALFNWLWAKRNGGKFILRIDDTDQLRNREEALGPILNAFKWLGLPWDEGPEIGGPHAPYYQSQRGGRYREMAEALLRSGHAYKDFETAEQTKADREAAEKEKRPYLSSRKSLEMSDTERQEAEASGKPFVVRLLVPRGEKVRLRDQIRGDVEWDGGLMPDPVIQRGDGSALYNFATVIDDIDFEITHVIRSEEHLTNTAIQVLVYQALGKAVPEFAHIPFVAAPSSTQKLSKRKIGEYRKNPQFKKLFEMGDAVLPKLGLASNDALSPVMVEFYEKMGFLPEAVLNALARLGWSLDDKTEFMDLDFIVQNFSLDRVVKGPAGLDPDKLLAYQEHWMGKKTLDEKLALCLPFLIKAGSVPATPDETQTAFVRRLIQALESRIKLASDILLYDEFFVADEAMTYDEKAFGKRIKDAPESIELLRAFRGELERAPDFTAAALDRLLHEWLAARGAQVGQIIHALRIAVSGKPAGPGMFDTLELVGRERCLARIDRTLAKAGA